MPKEPEDYNTKLVQLGTLKPRMLEMLVIDFQRHNGLDVDGKAGPKTRAALHEAMMAYVESKDTKPKVDWKWWDGPLSEQPRNRQEVYSTFGNPGTGKEDAKWTRANIVKAVIPGLPKHVWIHKLIEPYLREAVRRVQISRPDFEFANVAGHVFRHTRHNPSLPLSMHSWGIAVDINPAENFAKTFKPGEGPALWSPAYNAIWKPGPRTIDKLVVDAMASCGFRMGLDWNENGTVEDTTFYDAMHAEWVAGDADNKSV